MTFKYSPVRPYIWLLTTLVVSFLIGSCIFSPKEGKEDNPVDNGAFEDPVTPQKVIENLKVSFSHLEVDWYEKCLHENFFWESPSKTDELDVRWSRSEELHVIDRLMQDCTAFIFSAHEISSYEEWGSNMDPLPDGAIVSEDHPNEIWYVYNYTIDMDIFTRTYGDFKVHQDMQFKMVKDPDTKLYSVIRWIDITPE
ncbi:hypothetical protein LLG96_00995 [bacterium]|nr:hypothetical protein [bacterium]